MHPGAKRCLIWAIVLVVLGVLALAYGYELLVQFERLVGFNAEPAVQVFHVGTQVVRSFALPLAAGLVTATIIIQTIAPRPVAVGDKDA